MEDFEEEETEAEREEARFLELDEETVESARRGGTRTSSLILRAMRYENAARKCGFFLAQDIAAVEGSPTRF